MVIDYMEYYNTLKKRQCYGKDHNKKEKILDKLYEWQVVQFRKHMMEKDVDIVFED